MPIGVGELVHRGFDRVHRRRAARRAHGHRRGAVERHELVAVLQVLRVVERARPADVALRVLLEARGGAERVVHDRLELAVRVRAELQPLNGVRADGRT